MSKNNQQYHKTQEQKILRKHKKQWIILSTAIFGFMGLGYTQQVHADTNVSANNPSNNQINSNSQSTNQSNANNHENNSTVNNSQTHQSNPVGDSNTNIVAATTSSSNAATDNSTETKLSKAPEAAWQNYQQHYDQYDKTHHVQINHVVLTGKIKMAKSKITLKPNHQGIKATNIKVNQNQTTIKTTVNHKSAILHVKSDKLRPLYYTHGEIKTRLNQATHFYVQTKANLNMYKNANLTGQHQKIQKHTMLKVKRIDVHQRIPRFKLMNNQYVSANRFFTQLIMQKTIDKPKYQTTSNVTNPTSMATQTTNQGLSTSNSNITTMGSSNTTAGTNTMATSVNPQSVTSVTSLLDFTPQQPSSSVPTISPNAVYNTPNEPSSQNTKPTIPTTPITPTVPTNSNQTQSSASAHQSSANSPSTPSNSQQSSSNNVAPSNSNTPTSNSSNSNSNGNSQTNSNIDVRALTSLANSVATSVTNSLNASYAQAHQDIDSQYATSIANSIASSMTANLTNSNAVIMNSLMSSQQASLNRLINSYTASLTNNAAHSANDSATNNAIQSLTNQINANYQSQRDALNTQFNNQLSNAIANATNAINTQYTQHNQDLNTQMQSIATSLTNSMNAVNQSNQAVANNLASSAATSVTNSMLASYGANNQGLNSAVINSIVTNQASSVANSIYANYQNNSNAQQASITAQIASLQNSLTQSDANVNAANQTSLTNALSAATTSVQNSMANQQQIALAALSNSATQAITSATNSLTAQNSGQLSNAIVSATNSLNTSFTQQTSDFYNSANTSLANSLTSAITSAQTSLANSYANNWAQLQNDIKNNKHYYDILDYGAKAGDPNFDNATIINKIISNLPGDGGEIVIPTGDFYLNSPIVINHNYVHIQGQNSGLRSNIDPETSDSVHPGGGSRLIINANNAAGIQVGTANQTNRISGIEINGLNIMGANAQANHVSQDAISAIQNSDGLNIHDNTIINVDYGVVVHGGDTTQIKDNWISEVKNGVHLLDSSQQAQVESNYLGAQPTGISLKMDSPYAATISGNNIYPDGAENIELNNATICNITNNNLQSYYNSMLVLRGNNNLVSGNMIYSKQTKANPFGHDGKFGMVYINGDSNTFNSNQVVSEQNASDTRILVAGGNNNNLKMNTMSGTNNAQSNALLVVNGNANNTQSIYNDIPASGFQNGNNNTNVNFNGADTNAAVTTDLDNPNANNDFARSDKFDQTYHYNIPAGFMNDTQSIVKVGDHYNIYYLSNPLMGQGGQTNWELVQTTDFKTFTDKGIAIARNQGSWGSVATGSVVANQQDNGHIIDNHYTTNTLFAYFTGYKDNIQTVHKAYSTDSGLTFKPVSNDLVASPYNGEASFRDPKVFYNTPTNKLVMYIAEGTGTAGSYIHAYQSDDGDSWQYLGDASANTPQFTDNAPGNFECPNVINNVVDQSTGQKKTILFFSGNAQGHTNDYYSIGTMDNNGLFHADNQNSVQMLDGGTDAYAPNYIGNGDTNNINSITTVGWLGSWNQDWDQFTKDNNTSHIGSFTMPKTLTLSNGTLNTNVIEPQSKLLYTDTNGGNVLVSENAGKVVYTFNQPISNNQFQINQSDSQTIFNLANNQISVSQTKALGKTTLPLTTSLPGPIKQAIFYVDKSSIEMYLPEYQKIYTVSKFSNDTSVNVNSSTNGQIQLYHMGPGDDNSTPVVNNHADEINAQLSTRAQTDLSAIKNDDTSNFDKNWAYDGTDLGATYHNTDTQFKVWAPTAKNVQLIQYNSTDPNAGIKSITDMTRGANQDPTDHTKNDIGVYSTDITGDLNNTAYAYRITHNDGSVVDTQDPYSTSITNGGNRSVILNLTNTNPTNFTTNYAGRVTDPTQAIVGETHVRDFTANTNSGVQADLRGKYLGMVEDNTTDPNNGLPTGYDYLKQSKINYVQIMPVQDSSWLDDGDNRYGWGYDPKNYNALQAAYSTDPSDPSSSINQFKTVVQKLHAINKGVIMDVVYNHVASVNDSSFNKVMPGYYFRTDSNGNLTNGSDCGNDFASEREMTHNYILDSIKYWHEQYGIDGFRFDLMGDMDVNTINAIQQYAKQNNLLIYGEGWMANTNLADNQKANLWNANQLPNAGFFNGDLRDAITNNGSGAQGFVNGASNNNNEAKIVSGILGGQNGNNAFVNAGQNVSYVECHDDKTLSDKLWAANPSDNGQTHNARMKLANALITLNRGITYTQIGQEFWRNKSGADNANTGSQDDNVNALNWDYEQYHQDTVQNLNQLLQVKLNHPDAFSVSNYQTINSQTTIDNDTNNTGIVSYTIQNNTGKYVVVFNASDHAITIGNGTNQSMNHNYSDTNFDYGARLVDGGNITTNNGQVIIPSLNYVVYHFDPQR